VEVVHVEVTENARTSRILSRICPAQDGIVSLRSADGAVDSGKARAVIDELRHCPDARVKVFPPLNLADGERREADCQTPLRYAAEWNDDGSVKTWRTQGIGLKWSCEAEIDGNAVMIRVKPEDVEFRGWSSFDAGKDIERLKLPIILSRELDISLTLRPGTTVIMSGGSSKDTVRRGGREETHQTINRFFLSAEILSGDRR
jgi:hypothetical protein